MNKLKERIRSLKSILVIGATMLYSMSARADSYIMDYDSFSEFIVLSGTSYSFTVGDITWVYRNFKKGSPHSGSWNEGVVLVEARGNVEGDISIPAKTSDNRPVIALGSGLFSGNKNLDSVIIPESITMLFPSVFYGCEYLREVTIPDSVNEISGSIFAECSRLKKVKMGANTPCVSYRMFLDCASLETIEWGGKETFIGDQAFLRCTSLKNISIPDSVTSIGCSFQDCKNLTNVVFGAGGKSIGKSCFTGCTKLNSVTFGNSLYSIGESCFSGCSELRKVEMPDSLAVLGNYAFNDCSRITDVKIGAKVKIIGACAFLDCAKLTNIVWGANNEVVGESAFMRCSGLRELRLPNTITNIYSSAFKGCSNITNVHVGAGLKTMGAEAFADNGALCDIRFLGDKVRTIGNSCFSKCTSLACFEMPDSVREFGTYLFNGCNKLSCIKIGDSVETISEGFCMDCVSLTNIVWGAAVETIGYRAFLNCTSLYDLSIPDTVKTIGGYSFHGCTELRFVKIGTGCTSILGNAFYKCGHLLFVEAFGEIEEIGGNVFGDCTNLRYFSMNNSKAPISVDAYSFPRGNGACPLFCIFVNEGSSDWTGTDEIGLPESGIWKYWPIDYISNKPENIAAPYDFGFYTPNETPGYYGGVWPAPFYLTTADEFSALNPAITTVKEGDTIYLHYAFADRWRCETVENLTNRFTLASGGEKYSIWGKIETKYEYAYGKQKVFDFLQNLNPGTYTLTWELNVGKSLPETDYANNTTSITFTVVGVPKYKVSFNLNGASGTVPASRTVDEGCVVGELPMVTAPAGWTFLGWYTAATGGTKITSSKVVNSALTCYAQWEKRDYGDDDGGGNEGGDSGAVAYDASVARVYDGWLIAENGELAGIVQVKAAKQTVKKTVTNFTATATVTDVAGKKWSYSKGIGTVDGVVTGLVSTTKNVPAAYFDVKLGMNSLAGEWGDMTIIGARNAFNIKNDALKARYETAYLKKSWECSVDSDAAQMTLVLTAEANGKVKVAGLADEGLKINLTVQGVMGEDALFIPYLGTVKSGTLTKEVRFLIRIGSDGATEVLYALVSNFKDALISELADVYGPYVPGVAVSEELVFVTDWTVSGLPSGLKFDKKTGTVSGTPTKPATNTVVFTRTVDKVKHTASATFVVGAYPVVTVKTIGTGIGKVTGTGRYAANKKVTLKATANKGYVFNGWYYSGTDVSPEAEGRAAKQSLEVCSAVEENAQAARSTMVEELLTQAASYSFTMPETDVALYAKFVTAEEDAASIALSVDALGGEISPEAFLSVTNTCGVALKWSVAADAFSQPKVTVSGLPAGLKFTAKDIMKKGSKTEVEIPANTVYGAPTAESKLDAKTGLRKPSVVKFTVTTAGKSKRVYSVDMTVLPLPGWAVGTFNGGGDYGQVSLTVAKTGKLSGKYLSDGLTWSLAANSFDSIDESGEVYRATLIGKSGKLVMTNEVGVACDSMGGFAESIDYIAYQNNWKLEPWKSVGKPFAKAAALEYEDSASVAGVPVPGVLTLKFAASGAVTVKGSFVTGVNERTGKDILYTASGSAVLAPQSEPDETGVFDAVVFVYLPPKAGKFDGYVRCIGVRWTGEDWVKQ